MTDGFGDYQGTSQQSVAVSHACRKEANAVSDKSRSAVLEPPAADVDERPVEKQREATKKKPKRQPRYHVILWNDNDHTYEYVMIMMKQLFGHPLEAGFEIARRVDRAGRAICLTTTREHAELKVEQIRAFGADPLLPRSKGSMSASIEPESTD